MIAGYPDDEGIKLNGGRVGASQAPDRIRQHLYKMTPHFRAQSQPRLLDIGNLNVQAYSLLERHEVARQSVTQTLSSSAIWIGLGGGHDYGYADGAGFLSSVRPDENPLIINFDAHLDVRPLKNGPTSGTPFFRVLSEFPKAQLLEVGLQTQCNSKTHLQWLLDHGGRCLFLDEINVLGRDPAESILEFLNSDITKRRPTFLSVDMDSFANAFAPGTSQSFGTGIHPETFFKVLSVLLERLDVRILGLYETSPALDYDNHTSKLAALIVHHFIFSYSGGPK